MMNQSQGILFTVIFMQLPEHKSQFQDSLLRFLSNPIPTDFPDFSKKTY